MATKTIKITGDAAECVSAFMEERGISAAEAAEQLINTGYSRLAALEKYAASRAAKAPKKAKAKTKSKANGKSNGKAKTSRKTKPKPKPRPKA